MCLKRVLNVAYTAKEYTVTCTRSHAQASALSGERMLPGGCQCDPRVREEESMNKGGDLGVTQAEDELSAHCDI